MKEQDKNVVQKTKADNHISFSQLAAYGAGGIIPVALFNVAGILVGLMGNISLGLSAFWLGFILIIPRLWDAFSDPIIGHFSDNTRTSWGRRRPYLLIGGILVAVFFVIMWWIPKGEMVRAWFPTDSGFHAFQLGYILFTLLLFFTSVNIFEIPHGALGMEITTDYHERTRLFSAKSFVGNIFAMSTPWLFKLASLEMFKGTGGNEADGMRYVALMVAAILIPLSFWWFFKLREPGFIKASMHEKTPFWKDMKHIIRNKNFIMLTLTVFTLAMGFNFVQLLGSYIPIFYVFGGNKAAGATLLGINGTIWAITGVLAVFPLNLISPRLGKRNTLIISMVLICIAQLTKIVCYNPDYPYLIIIPTVLLSAGMLFFFTLGSSMVGDICDEDELKTGYRSEGSYYAIFWWFIKMGTALASLVAGALIVFTLFDEIQVTTVDRLQGNIREIRSKVQYWKDFDKRIKMNAEWIERVKKQISESLKESMEFVSYIERESQKKQDRRNQTFSVHSDQRKIMLLNTLAVTQSIINKLEQLKSYMEPLTSHNTDSINNNIVNEVATLTLQLKLIKARLNAYELLLHIENKSLKNPKSKEYYSTLIPNISTVFNQLTKMDPILSLESLKQELNAIDKEIMPLTRQTPFTLLMMRVVEIGLPLLLSVLSLFFIFRYSLTEKRCYEIKELLRQRNYTWRDKVEQK